MHPELASFTVLGIGIEIKAYSFFMFLAFVTIIFGSTFYSYRVGLAYKKVFWSVIISAAMALIGARILNIAINRELYASEPWRYLSFDLIGFSLVGGIVAAFASGYFFCRLFKIDQYKLADVSAVNLGIGIALMRVGCYLNGCCFGKLAEVPWAVKFPLFRQAHLHQIAHGSGSLFSVHPAHPTQLYELIAALIGAFLAYMIIQKKSKSGIAAAVFGVWFAGFRLFNIHFREIPNSFDAPDYFYPLVYLGVIVFCAVFLVKRVVGDKIKV